MLARFVRRSVQCRPLGLMPTRSYKTGNTDQPDFIDQCTEFVAYRTDGDDVKVLEYSSASERGFGRQAATEHPTQAVILLPNEYGITQDIKFQALSFNKLHLDVYIPDIYKGRVAQSNAEADEMANTLNMEEALMDIEAVTTMDHIMEQGLGVVGFGASGVLAINSTQLLNVDAAAMLYGATRHQLNKMMPLSQLEKPVQFHIGGRDIYMSPEESLAFEKKLRDEDVDFEVWRYPEATYGYMTSQQPLPKFDVAMLSEKGYESHEVDAQATYFRITQFFYNTLPDGETWTDDEYKGPGVAR